MIQGWHQDIYLIFFEEQIEAATMTARYGLDKVVPGYTVAGLLSWDDFLLIDCHARYHTVPTVPMIAEYVRPIPLSLDLAQVRPDDRFTDKIKWYIQPLIFGGSPEADGNISWITLDQHVEAVKWWNAKYCELHSQA